MHISPWTIVSANFSAKDSMSISEALEPWMTRNAREHQTLFTRIIRCALTINFSTSASAQLPLHQRPSAPESPTCTIHSSSEALESTTKRSRLWYMTCISSSRQLKWARMLGDMAKSKQGTSQVCELTVWRKSSQTFNVFGPLSLCRMSWRNDRGWTYIGAASLSKLQVPDISTTLCGSQYVYIHVRDGYNACVMSKDCAYILLNASKQSLSVLRPSFLHVAYRWNVLSNTGLHNSTPQKSRYDSHTQFTRIT